MTFFLYHNRKELSTQVLDYGLHSLVVNLVNIDKVSTTSPAGGLAYALPGRVAFPPEGGLTNHSFGYWWPLKSGSFLLLRVTF